MSVSANQGSQSSRVHCSTMTAAMEVNEKRELCTLKVKNDTVMGLLYFNR